VNVARERIKRKATATAIASATETSFATRSRRNPTSSYICAGVAADALPPTSKAYREEGE